MSPEEVRAKGIIEEMMSSPMMLILGILVIAVLFMLVAVLILGPRDLLASLFGLFKI
jgi:hypothetical protein